MAMNKKTKAASESAAFLAILGGIFVVLNLIGVFTHTPRLDLTRRHLFTLSEGSKSLAHNLKDTMEITGYFSSDLPPPFNSTERYVRDMLAEYAAASNGKIHVRFVDPNNDDKRKAAEEDGVQKANHQVIENDGVTTREGYRGLSFKYLGDKKQIPMVNDTSGLEYAITMIIKELANDKVKIGVVGGHGGPTLQKGLTSLKEALPTYQISEVSLGSEVSKDIKALLVIEPDTAFTDAELHILNKFVIDGGSLGVFGGTTKMDFTGQGPPNEANLQDSGINKLLAGWGAKIGDDLVADAQCGRAPMQTSFGIPIPVAFPLVPIVSLTPTQQEHPVMFKLNELLLPYTSSVTTTGHGDSEAKITTLARSSEHAWLLTDNPIAVQVRNPREWNPGAMQTLALALAIDGKLPNAFPKLAVSASPEENAQPLVESAARAEKPVRVIVVGSGKFMRDEFLPRPEQRRGSDLTGGLAFVLNAVDWLAQDSDLIAIRAKNIEDPLIRVPQDVTSAESALQAASDEADSAMQNRDREGVEKAKDSAKQAIDKRKQAMAAWDSKKMSYRVVNMIGLPLLVALFGVFRWQSRKAKKASKITV